MSTDNVFVILLKRHMEGTCAACGKECEECKTAGAMPGDECHCGETVEEKCDGCGNAMSGCTCG